MTKLAILGGESLIDKQLKPYRSIGPLEIKAVEETMRTGVISGFYGDFCNEFWGGPKVNEFENTWASRFDVRHAVTVNSATSALYAAIGAIGISPGDEVIVPPYTMSATVMAPIVYGGIPVFADIESDTFGLDPESVRQAITSKTKAILTVNLFGHTSQLDELMDIAKQNNIYLIEDNAQGPLAEDNGRLAGTIGHIGVFSLNYHKHIHTGEGGICVTDDDNLALRMKLIRNHGENVVEPLEIDDLTNLIGFNFRLTEIQAAIGIEQLKKIDHHVEKREKIAKSLSESLNDLPGIFPPIIRKGCRHVFYVWGAKFDEKIVGVSRDVFSKALEMEGFPHFTGYCKPLYHLPVFQKQVAFGNQGHPFNINKNVNYEKTDCPVCEYMYQKAFIGFEPCAYDINDNDLDLLIAAFRKVYNQKDKLITMSK
ncbi:MAG: DegT/DnrJ/EryC1/StrS family aminotransferase [Desulfobacterales bacterium]|nr:DegT/DnrJ/EryC1/StrS family aminotransferase [Desulfobacterales bacterium]